jgi:hypothetical protein
MLAELNPRIGSDKDLALEPRIGVQTPAAFGRELNFGGDLTIRVSQKLAVVLGYMMTLSEMTCDPKHSYTHNDISVSLKF